MYGEVSVQPEYLIKELLLIILDVIKKFVGIFLKLVLKDIILNMYGNHLKGEDSLSGNDS